MRGYRGYVVGPNGEHLAATTVTPEQLEAAREQQAERTRQAVEARKREEAEHRAEQDRLAHEAGARELAEYEEQCRQRLLQSGGDAADFVTLWPSLKAEYLRERVMAGPATLARAKDELRERMRAAGLGL